MKPEQKLTAEELKGATMGIAAILGELAGEASMCWSHDEIFQSDKALAACNLAAERILGCIKYQLPAEDLAAHLIGNDIRNRSVNELQKAGLMQMEEVIRLDRTKAAIRATVRFITNRFMPETE